MLGFLALPAFDGAPEWGPFSWGALEAGPCLLVEGFCSPGGWRGLSGGGRVPFARAAGPCVGWKGSVRSHSFHPWDRIDGERVRGAPRRAPDTPGSGQQNRRCAVPSPPFPRFRSVVDATSCSSRPQARVHAGLTWLVNSRSAILMPDPPPTLNLLCFTERLLSL
ncbi:Uncharacterised protein [Atlantibacter hermannii]|nr:Uncharacterised protein [Atlantibacter hermannii]